MDEWGASIVDKVRVNFFPEESFSGMLCSVLNREPNRWLGDRGDGWDSRKESWWCGGDGCGWVWWWLGGMYIGARKGETEKK